VSIDGVEVRVLLQQRDWEVTGLTTAIFTLNEGRGAIEVCKKKIQNYFLEKCFDNNEVSILMTDETVFVII
jgi:hypothetical protein